MDRTNNTICSQSTRVWTGSAVISAVIIIFAGLTPQSIGLAAAAVSPPVTTTMSIPFSGTISTDLEDISVSGILHIEARSTLTPTNIFSKVHSNISDTNGTGMTSGQKFVGVGAALQTCALPATPRGSNSVLLELTPQYQLSPSGPLSSLYGQVSKRFSLPLRLVLRLTFQRDGTISGVSVLMAISQFSSTLPESAQTRIQHAPRQHL